MSCVNIKHPEFIELTKVLDLHPDFLRDIIYEYQNSSPENEDLFPSPEYIKEVIQGKSMTDATEKHREVWETFYKNLKTFKTKEEALKYQTEANKYFNSESIVVTRVSNGNYEVTVAEPYTKEYIEEINNILKNAPMDSQGRLLAPNGKPSNLTEKQYAQVRTKAFINWFGDWINDPENASKVVDENGEPLVVYHGGPKGITIFVNPNEIDRKYKGRHSAIFNKKNQRGIYFINKEKVAGEYAESYGKNKEIYPVFLNIKNPKSIKQIQFYGLQSLKNIMKLFDENYINYQDIKQEDVDKLNNKGIDALTTGSWDNSTEYVVFNSNQIKSATDNIGTFSTTSNNIYTEREIVSTQGFSLDTRLQSLYDEQLENGDLKITDILSFINEDSDYYPIIKMLSSEKKNRGSLLTGVKIKIDDSIAVPSVRSNYTNETLTRRAYYDASTKTIHINAAAQFKDGKSDSVIMHEILHAITVDKILNNPKLQQEFKDIIDEYISKNLDERFKYGKEVKHRIEEFIADTWSNTETINKLKNTKSSRDVNLSLWDKIKNFFTGIFKDMSSDSLFAEASVKINELLDDTSIIRNKAKGNFFEDVQDSKKSSAEDTTLNTDEEYMRESSEILDQFDNLYSSNLLSVSELNELCNSVAYYISDLITDIQTKPDFAVSTFGPQYTNIDFSTKSKQEIVKIIGIDNIVKAAKLQFSPATRQDKDLKTISKYRLIQKNWKAIMKKASLELSRLEKFSIYASDKNIDREVLETQEEDNYLTESDIQELEGSTQEHWQIENRTIEIIGSLSQEMRNALLQCYILEKGGIKNGQRTYKKVLNKDGIPKRVKTKDAVYSILRWAQGSITLSDMINKLQSKSKDNPWITQILSRLQDTSGKESDFQSQFFSVFDLHFQSYSSGKKQKSGYSTSIVNENPALRGIISNIKVAYNIGNHLLFKPESIDKENYAKFHTAVEKITKTKYEGANTGELISAIQECLNLLGYSETAENILNALNKSTFNIISFNLSNLDKTITANLNNKSYNPFNYESENSILGYLNRTLQPFTDRLEDITVQSTYSNGKMYQSYVTPSYMSKLMLKFQQEDDASFDEFIANEYAKYEWFKLNGDTDNLDTGWRVSWLDRLSKDPQARKDFKHTVLLNFDKKYYMKGMSDMDYLMSVLSMYFSHKEKGEESLSWFRVPMLSNKPSSEFIQFYSKRGANYKEAITRDLKKVFDQELSRIQTVMARDYNKDNSKAIKNFDTNGRKFNFLPYMNEYLEGGSKVNTTLGKLLRAKLRGEQIDEAALNDLVQKAIYAYMDTKVTSIVDTWESNGIAEAAKGIRNIRKDNIRGQLENFIWNDVLASINIMELTITDPAFYANAEDIQKRFAQIHAPGVRGNIEARDYKGERVSDGFERTLYLTDFDDFKSNIIENLKVVFDRKISEAKTEQERKGLEALKESLLREPTYDAQGNLIDAGGDYWNINVADAQAYNSPTSYRKKAFIFGKWSRQKEQLYERLLNGEFNYSDLKEAFQPLKPFKYTQMEKESHVENAPMSKLKVPVQNKNAEYLLVLAGAILQDQDTGKPNLLRAIYKVMEDSTLDDSTKGIDTVQFVSAVKSGEMGAVNIKQFYDDKDGEVKAIAEMKAAIYNADGTYNNDRVHTTSFEDYCLQQEVPPHFLDHEQIHGSQIRYIVLGDLESTYLGQEVVYNVKDDATGEEQSYTAEEFKAEYEKLISENINDSINELARVLNVTGDTRSRNIALSKILQKEIDSDPRYGVDLMLACSLDEDGNFRIPLGDPIQSKRIEQLINSIIKNRVNKQTIPGGPVVQVSNFGTSRQLNIKFKDRQGNIINREDFNSDVEYRKFLEENQGGVAYYECFAPAYMQEIFTNFTKPDGTIDIETIEELDPELLKMVGYRIPTENKYSIIPMKIVGFLPKEAGEGIMLPNDITLITGSDYDVDKMYLMRKHVSLKTKPYKEIKEALYQELIRTKEDATREDKKKLNKDIKIFLENPQQMRNTDKLFQYMWNIYKKIGYDISRPTSGRDYRTNKIIDMTYEVMTHETTADKMLNPGGFEPQKKMAYLVEAYRNNPHMSWEELSNMTVKQLKKLSYTDKNLTFIDTHVDFYRQNAAAASLIGIFAVANIAHIILQNNRYTLDVNSILMDKSIDIMGLKIEGKMTIDSRFDIEGNSTSKVLGSLVASAADAVKDPVLNLMNINIATVNALNTLVRLGMPFDKAAMFLSQKSITNVLAEFNKENLNSSTSLSQVITSRLEKIAEEHNIKSDSLLNTEPLTEKEVIKGIRKITPEIEYKTLQALNKILKISTELSSVSFATRFNSMSSAVGPLAVDNLITEFKLEDFSKYLYDSEGNMVILKDILERHPILKEFARTLDIARYLLKDMPANSTSFRNILNILDGNLEAIKKDRALLLKLSDFYQSYILMYNEVINPKDLDYYITKYPTDFINSSYKRDYPDNPFIQAIRTELDPSTGLPALVIDTSGMKTEEKELLTAGWLDLYKNDSETAIQLFEYCFFKGGIGYTPKTFMHLLPMQIKEALKGYKETYSKMPSVNPVLVIDQFVRNNTDNNRLVPYLPKDIKPVYINKNAFEILDKDAKKLERTKYLKIKTKEGHKVYRQAQAEEGRLIYVEEQALGSKNAYLEMSSTDIRSSLSETFNVKEEENYTEDYGDTQESNDSPIENIPTQYSLDLTEEQKLEFVLQILQNNKQVFNRQQAEEKLQDYKSRYPSRTEDNKKSFKESMKVFIKNRMTQLGLNFNEEIVEDIVSKMC